MNKLIPEKFINGYVAMDVNGEWCIYSKEPTIDWEYGEFQIGAAGQVDRLLIVQVDYVGDWKDSLMKVEDAPFYLEWSHAIKYMIENPGEKLVGDDWDDNTFIQFTEKDFFVDESNEMIDDFITHPGFRDRKYYFYKKTQSKTVTVYQWRGKKATSRGWVRHLIGEHTVDYMKDALGDQFDNWEPIPGTEREVEVE